MGPLALGLGLLLSATLALAQSETDTYPQALQALASGQDDQAETLLLTLLKQNPRHAGAWLDLALLYCERGQASRAFALFDEIERRFEPPSGIQGLIRHYRQQGCHASARQATTRTTLSYALGHADNVNLAPSSERINILLDWVPATLQLQDSFRPKADAFQELSLYVDHTQQNASLQFMLQGRLHQHTPEQDSVYALAGWVPNTQLQLWATHLQLGGQAYQQGLHALLSAPAQAITPEVQLARLLYPSASGYDAWQIEPRLRWRWQGAGGHHLELAPGYLWDKASGQRPGGDRHGATLQALWWMAPAGQPWDWGARLRWQHQRDASDYGGLWQHTTRENDYWRLQAWLGYALSKQQRLALEWTSQRASDRVDLFDYNNTGVYLLWQYNM